VRDAEFVIWCILMAEQPRYYVTTAIAYPNGPPHIGHAYEAIATDAIARFMRLDGYDVYFLTGTDEHGIKMLQTAGKEKLTPRELVERNVPRFKAMVERLECSNDDFIRTTEQRHHLSSAAIWQRMEQAGDIYLSKYSGWYSVRDEAYYDESETKLGDGGERLGPQGTPVEWVEEDSYFFRLSAYQQKLIDLYEKQPRSNLDEVLGPDSQWREKWARLLNRRGPAIVRFFADENRLQLEQLGYCVFVEKEISSPSGPIYRLIFASKHPLGLEFWDKVTGCDRGGQLVERRRVSRPLGRGERSGARRRGFPAPPSAAALPAWAVSFTSASARRLARAGLDRNAPWAIALTRFDTSSRSS